MYIIIDVTTAKPFDLGFTINITSRNTYHASKVIAIFDSKHDIYKFLDAYSYEKTVQRLERTIQLYEKVQYRTSSSMYKNLVELLHEQLEELTKEEENKEYIYLDLDYNKTFHKSQIEIIEVSKHQYPQLEYLWILNPKSRCVNVE